MDTRKIQSHRLGENDGKKCGAHLLTTYDKKKLVELLGDLDMKFDDVYFMGFLKSEKEVTGNNFDFQTYLDGFHQGYRESLELDSENLDIGGSG